MYNMDLKVECELSDGEWYILCETEGWIDVAISRLHVEDDRWVVCEAETMTNQFRHCNYLTSGVQDTFGLLAVVNYGKY